MTCYKIQLCTPEGITRVAFADDESTAYKVYFKFAERQSRSSSHYTCTLHRDRQIIDRCAYPIAPFKNGMGGTSKEPTCNNSRVDALRANLGKWLKFFGSWRVKNC